MTTSVNQKNQISAFHSYLKNNVKEQLKLNVEKHICFEIDQSGFSPILPKEKLKPQPFVNFDSKKFSIYYSLLRMESNTATQEDEQQDSINEEIEAEIKRFYATEYLNEET